MSEKNTMILVSTRPGADLECTLIQARRPSQMATSEKRQTKRARDSLSSSHRVPGAVELLMSVSSESLTARPNSDGDRHVM
jgi:hypothetical protein